MKINRFFLLLIAVIIFFSFLSYIFYNFFVIERVVMLNMKLKVGSNLGLNVDNDCINFGKLMPDTSGERSIWVGNNATYPLRVIILKSGYIADWVEISENNFILKEKEQKKVIFEAFAPMDSKFGNYTGGVKVIFKKSLFDK